MKLTLATISTLALLFSVLASPTYSQTPKKATVPAKAAWQVNCSPTDNPNVLSCTMSQTLTVAKTGRRLIKIVVRPQPDHKKKQPAILLTLPHGLLLQAGVELQIDNGEKSTLALRTSDKDGVYTATAMKSSMVKALKAGNLLKVTMTAANGKKIAVQVSLLGFTAAFNKMTALK